LEARYPLVLWCGYGTVHLLSYVGLHGMYRENLYSYLYLSFECDSQRNGMSDKTLGCLKESNPC
jgi:hypothetical protein